MGATVILKEDEAETGTRTCSLRDQARALALILRDEFGTPFALFDIATGEPVRWGQEPKGVTVDTSVLLEVATEGRARVVPVSVDRYLVTLLLHVAGKAVLVAAGELTGLARTVPEAVEECARLLKWVQAVSDRLRLTDQLQGQRRQVEEQTTQVQSAWEVVLTTAHLTRGVRIHREPARNRQRILAAGHGLLAAEALAWVPQQLDELVAIQGEAILAPADWRNLAGALSQNPNTNHHEPIVMNEFQKTAWGARFAPISSLLAFPINHQGLAGWVIAINKRRSASKGERAGTDGPTPFRRSDAALLTPFVALLELHDRAGRRYQDLKDLLVGLTRSLTAALDAKDSYTYGHSERVARIAVELGRELRLEGDELADIYLAGLLHDVGKIGIRDAVLGKMEALTPEEFEHIKRHVTIGYSILSDMRQIRNLLPGVLYHHERWDGRGYPEGLAGEAIPLLARILSVADAYDAMSTTRPYRDAIPCRRVEEILQQGAGTQWDRRVIEAFLRCKHKIHTIRQRGVGESLQQAIDGALRIDNSLSQWKSDALPRLQEG